MSSHARDLDEIFFFFQLTHIQMVYDVFLSYQMPLIIVAELCHFNNDGYTHSWILTEKSKQCHSIWFDTVFKKLYINKMSNNSNLLPEIAQWHRCHCNVTSKQVNNGAIVNFRSWDCLREKSTWRLSMNDIPLWDCSPVNYARKTFWAIRYQNASRKSPVISPTEVRQLHSVNSEIEFALYNAGQSFSSIRFVSSSRPFVILRNVYRIVNNFHLKMYVNMAM